MGQTIELTASDGHRIDAYVAEPTGRVKAGLIILQEFFGVNDHIKRIVDDYAARGYNALAPALFDRVEKNVDLPYDADGMKRGRELRAMLQVENTLLDIQTAADAVAKVAPGHVAAVGYCWGGVLAYLGSLRLRNIDAVVAYYGATIPDYIDEKTKVPVLLHFSERDEYMVPGDVQRVAAAHPEIELYTYPGTDHGFNCDVRQFYNAEAAALALDRTLAFLNSTFG